MSLGGAGLAAPGEGCIWSHARATSGCEASEQPTARSTSTVSPGVERTRCSRSQLNGANPPSPCRALSMERSTSTAWRARCACCSNGPCGLRLLLPRELFAGRANKSCSDGRLSPATSPPAARPATGMPTLERRRDSSADGGGAGPAGPGCAEPKLGHGGTGCGAALRAWRPAGDVPRTSSSSDALSMSSAPAEQDDDARRERGAREPADHMVLAIPPPSPAAALPR